MLLVCYGQRLYYNRKDDPAQPEKWREGAEMVRIRWGIWAAAVTALALCAMLLYGVVGRAAPQPLTALPAPSAVPSAPAADDGVDINTADLDELMTLPGIGPVKAQAILDYREREGDFRYPEELIYVPGIGEGMLETLMDHITAGGG